MTENDVQSLVREIHGTVRVLDERTQSILKQAEKTNGRVNKLEDDVSVVVKKQENLAVKVGAGVMVAGTILVTLINKIFQ